MEAADRKAIRKIDWKLAQLFLAISLLATFFGIINIANLGSILSNLQHISADKDAESAMAAIELQRIIIIISVIGMCAVAFVVFYYVRQNIYLPIQQLESAMRKIEQGDYSVRLDFGNHPELRHISEAFNKAAEQLAHLEEERKQIDKAKTQFLSITSHELRSPMTPMKAQLQMLEQGYLGKLNRKQRQSLEIILRNADRLDKILVDFLDISRIEAARLKFEFRKTDLAATAREVIKYMKGYMPEKKIKIKDRIEKLPIIEADPDRVSQVLRNLIGNAIKFSNPGGTVDVSARAEGNFILFSVKDRGIGISKENQLRLFEPFFQVDKSFSRSRQGTGLGLAICRGIIESQGGKIWVESEEGKGSTFYFTVPFEPVREIKPIRILFSARAELEDRLKSSFKEYLGPMGESEFESLKKEGKLSKKGMQEYIEDLFSKGIIGQAEKENFAKSLPEGF
ncbi:MAG: HAMP domain-containing histidine kinase [Candidatus Micrarchaeota archaeon]|nr:HAMP domain-containing histidine kinase [Candidatus Micrarchaeota archaeon]